MKKTFEFSADDEKYMLKNTNPNEKKAEFVIESTKPPAMLGRMV